MSKENQKKADDILKANRLPLDNKKLGHLIPQKPVSEWVDLSDDRRWYPIVVRGRLPFKIKKKLSSKQVKIVNLLIKGCSEKEISVIIKISEGTIWSQVDRIKKKLR